MNRKTTLIIAFSLGILLIFWVLSKNIQLQTFMSNLIPASTKTSNKWYTYSSSLKYKILYPENYVIESSGFYSILLFKPAKEPGAGPMNFIYVSIVQPNMVDNEGEIYNYNPIKFKTLNGLKIGESISLADADQPVFDKWFTYTRLDDVKIDGHTAKQFENNNPWELPKGTTEIRYIFEANGYIYILGYYYGGERVINPIDANEAFNVVSSFRLNK